MNKDLTNKTTWVPLWHIYQPPNQSKYWVEKVAKESYEAIIRIYEKHPSAKLCLNINGSLTQLLLKHNLYSVIDGFKRLAENGQLEFVSTLCYHAIAPLIPEKELIRQIKLNDKINRKAFGKAYQPKGVWLPEMAYAKEVIKPLAKLGYRWISLAGVSSNGTWTNTGYTYVAKGKHQLNVLFRDDHISLDIAFGRLDHTFLDLLRGRKGTFCFTTMDGETIGHHQKKLADHLDQWLTRIEQSDDLITMTPSEVFEHYPLQSASLALPSSWSTTYSDIMEGNFFPLWLEQNEEPFKSAHRLAWKHLYTLLEAINLVETALQDKTAAWEHVRTLVDQCLFSCSYWWFTREASHRSVSRFLADLDMQGRAMRMLLALHNAPQLHQKAEQNEHLREQVYELLNNYAYDQ